jgi:hypothetical protein
LGVGDDWNYALSYSNIDDWSGLVLTLHESELGRKSDIHTVVYGIEINMTHVHELNQKGETLTKIVRPQRELWEEIRRSIESGEYVEIKEASVKGGKVYVGTPYNGRRTITIVLSEEDSTGNDGEGESRSED